MTKKLTLQLSVLLIILALLVSCGKKNNGTADSIGNSDKDSSNGESADLGTNESTGDHEDVVHTPGTGNSDKTENGDPDEDVTNGDEEAKEPSSGNDDVTSSENGDTPPIEGGTDDVLPENGNTEQPENNETTIPESGGNSSQNGGTVPTPNPEPETPTVGTSIGDLAPVLDLEKLGGGTVNTEDFAGKVVVINVWGTWCPPCRNELPDFDRIASEYDGEVVVLAVHSNSNRAAVPNYVNANFSDSKIVFAYDTPNEAYHSLIGGTVYYPRTVVLDKNGVITYADDGAISYDYLKYLVNNAGANN